jgi:hypothetical protein
MYIDFNVFKLKPESKSLKRFLNLPLTKIDENSEFVVVGEDIINDNLTYVFIVPIENGCITFIDGLYLNEAGYSVNEDDIYYTKEGFVFDVPSKYITTRIFEKIQEINEKLEDKIVTNG